MSVALSASQTGSAALVPRLLPGTRRPLRDFERVRDSTLVVREPVGVVGTIAAWNFPQAILMFKVAPALLAGCTVVVKPATETSLDALLLAEILDAAGLPPGAFNVVPADRHVGEPLVTHAGNRQGGIHGIEHEWKADRIVVWRRYASRDVRARWKVGRDLPRGRRSCRLAIPSLRMSALRNSAVRRAPTNPGARAAVVAQQRSWTACANLVSVLTGRGLHGNSRPKWVRWCPLVSGTG